MVPQTIKTPISEAQVRNLKVKDVIYISGTIVTARDQAHRRALEWAKQGKSLPVDLAGLVVFHCGPVMERRGEEWVAVAAGPTTSIRMELYEDQFLKAFGPRIIVGKGGMGKKTTTAMAENGSAYCAFTGGAAVLAAQSIRQVKSVEWLDLGMPEAMWVLEVQEFGPLIVGIDSHGNNLFTDISLNVEANKLRIYEKFGLK
jgi:fumarate hydratase subunit beta